MCIDILYCLTKFISFIIYFSLHCSRETVAHQIRTESEYIGDIFDDLSLCQRICRFTADNSSTETMSLIVGEDNHCNYINNSTMI